MQIIYGLICLFFIIFFHELGHFFAAKICGVKVESFSLGIGPWYIHKKIRDTDYRLSLIPLGGYCGMKGERDFSKSLEAKLDHIEAEPDSLYGVHPLKRLIIAFAGPLNNFIFAIFAFTLINCIGFSYWSYSSQIKLADEVYPEIHSAARDAGLISGDIIKKIDNKEIENFSDILSIVSTNPDKDLLFIIDRSGTEFSFKVHTDLDKKTGSGKIGVIADENSEKEYKSKSYSFFPALYHGFMDTVEFTATSISSIFTLFKGVDLTEAVSGPARVADLMGNVLNASFIESVKTGIINMLQMMALISISLGIMNLLPIPILDGGLILFAFLEFIFHRKISPKVLYYIQIFGLIIIGILFIIGLVGDIKYFVGKL